MKRPKQTECPCCGVTWMPRMWHAVGESEYVKGLRKGGVHEPVNVRPECIQIVDNEGNLFEARLAWECQACGYRTQPEAIQPNQRTDNGAGLNK